MWSCSGLGEEYVANKEIWEAKVIQKAQNWEKKNYTSLLWDKALKWKHLKPILPL